jgi:hypothetical protein
MLFVGCILCIVNDFLMHRSVDVMGVVDFLCTVRLMFLVWWIFYVSFG